MESGRRSQEERQSDTSLDSVNENASPPLPQDSQFVTDSNNSEPHSDHLISTNDILNHDYNQLRIDEGRQHRMNLKKENTMSRRDQEDMFITHVTLNLDIVGHNRERPNSGAGSNGWKYNAIKKNNSFAKPTKQGCAALQTRPSTSRSTASNQSKEPFLFLSNHPNNRRSTNASECSDTPPFTSTFNNSEFANRTKYRIGPQPLQSQFTPQSSPQTPQGFSTQTKQNAVNKPRPASNLSSKSKPLTYMDIIRSNKSSADSCSSLYSYTNYGNDSTSHNFSTASNRNNPRHSYTAAEFNKFKSKLLKNHSRNYYAYDSINLNDDCLKQQNASSNDHHQTTPTTNVLFQQGHSICTNDSRDISHKAKPEKQLSQIKSIYETIERGNSSRLFSLQVRRSNYLNNAKNAGNVLGSSLTIQKMSQRT